MATELPLLKDQPQIFFGRAVEPRHRRQPPAIYGLLWPIVYQEVWA